MQVVTSIDLFKNDAADKNVVIKNLSSWPDQHQEVVDGLSSEIGGDKMDAIFCVAGGWAGGNAASESKLRFFQNILILWLQHHSGIIRF